jgi:hypothetical protein
LGAEGEWCRDLKTFERDELTLPLPLHVFRVKLARRVATACTPSWR